jgi:hypothetical protein
MPALDTMNFDDEAVQVIVYGPPKAGKTAVVGKLSYDFDVIWFDGEGGGQTLTQLPKEQQARINYFRVVDTPEKPKYIETALKVMTGLPVKVCHEHGHVTCPECLSKNLPMSTIELGKITRNTVVVWDSLTQLTMSAFFKTAKAGKVDVEAFKDKFEFDHWGYQGALLNKYLAQTQGATWHNVVISHEASLELEDGTERVMPAGGTRNQSRNVARFFGHAVFVSVDNLKHVANSSTVGKAKVLAGSRTDVKVDMTTQNPLLPLLKASVANANRQAPVAAVKPAASILTRN